MNVRIRKIVVIAIAIVAICFAAFVLWESQQEPKLIPEKGDYTCINLALDLEVPQMFTLSEKYCEIDTEKGKVKCEYTVEHTVFSGDIIKLAAIDQSNPLDKAFDGAKFAITSPQILRAEGDYPNIKKDDLFKVGVLFD